MFTSERQRHKITSPDISVDGIKAGATDNIKYVGIFINHKKMDGSSMQKIFRNIAKIRRDRRYHSLDSCEKLASG